MSMKITARHHTKPPTLIGHDEDTWSEPDLWNFGEGLKLAGCAAYARQHPISIGTAIEFADYGDPFVIDLMHAQVMACGKIFESAFDVACAVRRMRDTGESLIGRIVLFTPTGAVKI